MIVSLHKLGWKHLVAMLMIALVLIPASLFVQPPQTAHAQGIGGFGGALAAGAGAAAGALVGCVLNRYGIDILEWVEESLAAAAEWVLDLFGIDLDSILDDVVDDVVDDVLPTAGDTVPVTVEQYGEDALEQQAEVLTETVGESAASIASSEQQLVWKECFLDPIAWALVEWLIVAITDDLVTWINTGFEGAPAFVTDFDGFLLDVGDRVIGDIIEGSDLAFLCDPFELDVRIALTVQYFQPTTQRSACTLSDVVENMDDFLAGAFDEGGWRGWFELTAKPKNNRYGGFMNAQIEAAARIRGERYEREKEIGPDLFRPDRDEEGNIQTPGRVIETQLQNWLDAPREQLVVADEIDEVLSALFEHFITELLTGVGGLLGYNEPDASGDSFSDRVKNANDQAFELQKERLIARIDATISSEQQAGQTQFIGQLQQLKQQVNNISADAANRFEQLRNAELQLLEIRRQIRARGGGGFTGGTTGGITGGGTTGGVTTGGAPPPPPPPPPPGGATTGGTTTGGTGSPLEGSPTISPGTVPQPPPPLGGTSGGTTAGGSTGAGTGSQPGGVPNLPPAPPQDFI